MTVIGGSTDHLVVDRAGNAQADRVLDVQTLAGVPVTDVTAPTGWTGEAFPTGQARADANGYLTFVVPDATGPVQVRTAAYTVGTQTFAAGPWLTPSGQVIPDSGVDQALDARVLTADLPTVDLSTNTSLSNTYARVKSVQAVPYGDGTTDATAHIQSVIDAANAENAGVYVPAGDYKVTAPLENVSRMRLAEGARIFAGTAAMAAVVRTQESSRIDNGYLVGKGTIDAGTNASIGVHLRNFLYFELSGVEVRGGNVAAVKLGSSTAPGRSAEAILSNLRLYNAGNVVAGSRGILVENSGDHSVSQALINNYEVGVTLPAGGNAVVQDVHVWTEPAKGATRISFEDFSNNSHYVQCHADTPSEFGFRLYGYQTTLVQCGTYNNPTAANATDNIVVGVKFEGANAIGTIVGHYFLGGSAAKRLKADIEAADGNYGLIQSLGCSNQFTATVRSLGSRLVSLTTRDAISAGQGFAADAAVPTTNLGMSIRTAGKDRWKMVSDGAAETGANAGSGLLLRRYADDGTFLGDVFFVARTGTMVMYSNLLMGPAASIIPDGTNGLKIGTNATQKVSLYGVPPVAQPQTAGQTTGHAAGTGAAVTVDSTFTGNWGTTGYTITDVVQAMKKIGALKG